jgi:hypothetical protein
MMMLKLLKNFGSNNGMEQKEGIQIMYYINHMQTSFAGH